MREVSETCNDSIFVYGHIHCTVLLYGTASLDRRILVETATINYLIKEKYYLYSMSK